MQRAEFVLLASNGKVNKDIAVELGIMPNIGWPLWGMRPLPGVNRPAAHIGVQLRAGVMFNQLLWVIESVTGRERLWQNFESPEILDRP